MRSIGILGPSYCGSTMIGCILGSLPGVGYAGETHWLIDQPGTPTCRCRCGDPKCNVFELADPLRWWESIAECLGVETVVSGDKSAVNYDAIGYPETGLLLVRNAGPWVASWVHHQRLRGGDVVAEEVRPTDSEVVAGSVLWRGMYGSLSAARPMFASWHELSVDAFLDDPRLELQRLCGELGLEFRQEALTFEEYTHHHIGGNAQVGMRRVVGHRPRFHAERRAHFGGIPRPDTLWKRVLTDKQQQLVEEQSNGG